MRSILVLLLLAVFFLTGLVLGVDRGQDNGLANENTVSKEKVENVKVAQVSRQTKNEDVMKAEPPPNLTQQAASFMESSVKGFYNLVVELIYGFVHVFFGS